MFEWTQPIGRKAVKWRPLTVGEYLDAGMVYHRPEEQVNLAAELHRRRIVAVGEAKGCDYSALMSWDALDFKSFLDEVEQREKRHAAELELANGAKHASGEWTMPDGTTVLYRPITVGDEIEIAKKHSLGIMQSLELVRCRITGWGERRSDKGEVMPLRLMREVGKIEIDLLSERMVADDLAREEAAKAVVPFSTK